MKISLVSKQMSAGNLFHYSSNTDGMYIWRILHKCTYICVHVCIHMHVLRALNDTLLSTVLLCSNMNGRSSEQLWWSQEFVNILSYQWPYNTELLMALSSIDRFFKCTIKEVFSFPCLIFLQTLKWINIWHCWNSRCKSHILGFLPLHAWSHNKL